MILAGDLLYILEERKIDQQVPHVGVYTRYPLTTDGWSTYHSYVLSSMKSFHHQAGIDFVKLSDKRTLNTKLQNNCL